MQNMPDLKPFKSPVEFAAGFHGEEKMWRSLVAYAAKDSIQVGQIPGRNKEILKTRIKALLARLIWRSDGYFQVSNQKDPVVLKAIEEINKP